jgi:hypothetical protein
MFSFGGVDENAMQHQISVSRIKKGNKGVFEYPNFLNNRAIDYANYTTSWKNFTKWSEKLDQNQNIHYID